MNQFHDDTFTLNDITFTVPPLEIRIDKEAANFSWQTLRTRNAQHVKSGHGVVNISFSAVFVGEEAINNQLRYLVAQLKLTPICYAENTFLRQSLLPDRDVESKEPVILLIMKSLTITVQPELKDTVVAHFQFSWFNYEPYSADLRFKSDTIGDPTPRSTPSESEAWKKFYRAEMGEFNSNAKYIPVSNLDSSTKFIFSLLAIEDARKLKGTNYKATDIKYETSNFIKDGLTLHTAETSVDCNPESGFVVIGITISFENIIAALPVLGHQYMTYQHIGSIDPRIMIRIMTVNDAARGEISSMWKTVEQNAIQFRHVPQEFLNVKIVNQVTQLCGLSTFITESLTEETIPGQPGTFALNLTLKGTDYLKTRESLDQEFVTTEEVRNAIFKVLSNQIKKTGKPYEVVPIITKDGREAALFDSVDQYAKLVSSVARESGGRIGSAAHALIVVGSDSLSVGIGLGLSVNVPIHVGGGAGSLQVREGRKIMDVVENPISTFFKDVRESVVAVYPQQGGRTHTSSPSSQSFPLSSDDKIVNLRLMKVPQDIGIDSFTYLQEAITKLVSLADKITLSGILDLPQFYEVKKLADKLGVFQGRSAYPDFPALQSVAEAEGKNPLSFDPAFYFYSSMTDTSKNMIDPGYLAAAEQASRSLYVDGPSTNGVDNFINKINNFVEETYKNRFEPDSSIRKSIDKSKADIKKLYPKDSPRAEANSNMKRELVSGLTYNNATANMRALKTVSFGNDTLTKGPGVEGTETPVESADFIDHHGDFAAMLGDSAQTYRPSEREAMGMFTHPLGNGATVTSGKGLRDIKDLPEASKNHKGVDFSTGGKAGLPVHASFKGKVVQAEAQDPNDDQVGYGNRIRIEHPNGYKTVYAHLSKIDVKRGDRVRSGQIIGWSGGVKGSPGAGTSTGPHLHFEIIKDGVYKDPLLTLASTVFSRDSSSGEGFQFGQSIFARSLESLNDDMVSGQGPSMKRAYPTFKLYFVEEDVDERIFGFDDFFNYSSVKSIRVVRSRKIPADLCVIELTNISGILSNRKFKNNFNKKGEFDGDKARSNAAGNGELLGEKPGSPLTKDTAKENPIASLMLQEGIKILLKLGYENDPDKLENVFVGQIVEVEFNDTDDLVTIVCQSFATELTSQIKGLDKPEKNSGWFLGTNDAVTTRLLSSMLYQPEVLHFGRWRRSRANGVRFGILSTDQGSNTNLDILTNKYEWNVRPQDDNIFAPLVSSNDFAKYFSVQETDDNVIKVANFLLDSAGVNKSFNLNFINYYIYKTTIWEIFKEMELRHPGCISSPVPYMDARMGPRMTMFFGMPNQLYFARDPSLKEQRTNNVLEETVKKNEATLRPEYEKVSDLYGLPKETIRGREKTWLEKYDSTGFWAGFTVNKLAITDPGQFIRDKQRKYYLRDLRKNLAIANKTIRPFRSYHILTSHNHIIENNIRASSLGVFNTVSVEYKLGRNEFFSMTEAKKTFRLKADAGIPDEEIQEIVLSQYESCEGETMGEFYALGALKQTLRDIYKGEITIIGNPSIKPYDICYVFDEYSDMVGPVEVEQVVHYFSQETGFITEITPDICVSINEWTTMGTMDAVGLVVEDILDRHYGRQTRKEHNPSAHVGDTVGKAIYNVGVSLPVIGSHPATAPLLVAAATTLPVTLNAAPLVPLGLGVGAVGLLAGAFVANKLVHWSQFRHPITFSPLLHKGRPFMAAMSSKTINANWWTTFFGDSKHPGWIKDGIDGAALILNDVGDSLVIASSTGSLHNIGVD